VGSSPLVSGFFWDDIWPAASGNFPDASAGKIVEDTGMTTADLVSITAAYNANMAALEARTLAEGKLAWQILWTGGDPNGKGSTCPSPLVKQASCATDLRALCAATSPQQVNRTLMYAFGPGGCRGDPSNLVEFEQDLANFLLVRGPHSYLGHGWLGCSRDYASSSSSRLPPPPPYERRRVVVTGIGMVTPLGADAPKIGRAHV
jgi:hypothetical protein